MKKLYKLFLLFFFLFTIKAGVANPNVNTCNWAGRNPYTSYWDSCSGRYFLNGYIGFNSPLLNCFKFQWTVNGVVVGTGRTIKYPITQNGTYNLCVAVTDTCYNCDTSFCSTRVITCIPNNSPCNWANLYTAFWDSCTTNKKATYGYATLNNCYKYLWKVNGVAAGTTRTLTYNVTQNGTYNVCLTVTDTCTHCDTTICSTRTFTCFPPACNWANLYTTFWDSCTNTKKAIYGYSTLNNCYKYLWKVNGVAVGTTRTLTYNVTQNGTYNVCLTLNDTCTHCDTTICSTRTFTCFPPACNWANLYTAFWDSCTSSRKGVYAYASLNNCYKYLWRVNNVIAGTGRILSYPVTQSGTYSVCLTVSDTCAHCDTVICSTRILTCANTCNWANLYTAFWDSCTTNKKATYGYATLNNCYKYLWIVNGVAVGTTRTLTYNVTHNGTYNVCLTVSDTCTHCDTTICSTRTFTCFPPACNWANLNTAFWDSCTNTKKGVYAYASLNNCYKYLWRVNNVIAGTTRILSYPVTQSGTYNVCLTVTDTCTHCDTTICSTRVLTCANPCSWSTRLPYINFWDSCIAGRKGVNGYITFNSNMSCLKFKWTVNGQIVGTNRWLNYPLTQNGTYVVCVSVTDTCNHCDTSFCSTRVLNCITPAGCHWSDRIPYLSFWDSCTSRIKALYGYIAYPNTTNNCYKYQWKVNGQVVGTNRSLNYPVTQNGTYSVCVTVTDTCNHCDTTYCSTRVLTCANISPCNWSSRNPYTAFWDSCTGRYSLNGYIGFNSSLLNCFKYQWKVNGVVVGTGRTFKYLITQNGTYNLCVTVSDTCNHCDTSFCSVRTITCIHPNTTPCNWKSRTPYVLFWDSCTLTKQSLNGYIYFGSSMSCMKFQWKVNGVNAGTGRSLSYPVNQNGTYNVCIVVTDTCNHCDTSFCSTRTITCINPTGCNWSNEHPYTYFWDSCYGSLHRYSVNGYIAFNSNYLSCFKYQWKVNGVAAGNTHILNYPITENGTYNVCVTVNDTCRHCDTTICSTRTITCVQLQNQQNTDAVELQIYPNPSRGVLNLFYSDESASFTLTDPSGKVAKSGSLVKGNQTLDLSKFAAGVYLLSVQTKNGVMIKKIMLEN